jgi:hypothetical protein
MIQAPQNQTDLAMLTEEAVPHLRTKYKSSIFLLFFCETKPLHFDPASDIKHRSWVDIALREQKP